LRTVGTVVGAENERRIEAAAESARSHGARVSGPGRVGGPVRTGARGAIGIGGGVEAAARLYEGRPGQAAATAASTAGGLMMTRGSPARRMAGMGLFAVGELARVGLEHREVTQQRRSAEQAARETSTTSATEEDRRDS
jgi:hypothetical protein